VDSKERLPAFLDA